MDLKYKGKRKVKEPIQYYMWKEKHDLELGLKHFVYKVNNTVFVESHLEGIVQPERGIYPFEDKHWNSNRALKYLLTYLKEKGRA